MRLYRGMAPDRNKNKSLFVNKGCHQKIENRVETAKAAGINPEKYVEFVLRFGPNTDKKDFDSLLPWNADFSKLDPYREALEKFSIPYDKRYVIQGGLSAEEGAAAVEKFMSQGLDIDGLFGFTETSTLGAKSTLQKMNYRIPEDVSLCCISGTTLCTLVHPTVTAVEQPVVEMATLSCRLLLGQIADPNAATESVMLRGNIVERESFRT